MTDDVLFDDNDDSKEVKSRQKSNWSGPPLFQNSNIGVAVWPNKDKNGNWYLTVDMPLLNNFQIFVNNGAYDDMEKVFNKLVDNYDN